MFKGPQLVTHFLRDKLLVGALCADAGWIALIALLKAWAIFLIAFGFLTRATCFYFLWLDE